jgi:hypothetical protein
MYAIALIMAAAYAVATIGPGSPTRVAAQAEATATPLAGTAYVTNTYSDEPAINVRVGPNTATYEVCGSLPYGATAVALGTTPASVWVQIEHQGCPGGVGWVYAAYVTLTGALRVVEPPPTPPPLATATLDPTLVAAFQVEPTVTRLPTFTPPPPISRPTFPETARPSSGLPAGAPILGITLLASVVLIMSFVSRR